MSKLWGGRFDEKDMDKAVLAFTSSLDVDKTLARYDCLSSRIHVEMLSRCGFISSTEKRQLVNALDKLIAEIEQNKLKLEGYEDIHSAVHGFVRKEAGSTAEKMHTARSRNEQIVNDVRLYCKDSAAEVKKRIRAFQKSLIALAEKAADIIIPGYTHLNRAQPVLFAHLVMAYVEMLERDTQRVENSRDRLDLSVMGSGALAGSSMELDRKFTAEKLGFKNISANSIDAVSDRDFIIEFVAALAILAVHLSRICEDFILYSTREFGLIELSDRYCTGSSLMPQKKNPDVLELVRGRTAHVIGSLNSLLVLTKGLPHSYNRDLQEDKKPLIESVELILAELGIMADLAGSVRINKENALKMLEDEFIYATDLVEYLVKKGLAFSEAHEAVGRIVSECVKRNINISDLSITELKKFSEKLEEDAYGLLNPEVSVAGKKTEGSTNPRFVSKEIARWKKKTGGA